MGSSPGGSSTSSKHSSHTLEQSNIILYGLAAENLLRSEPPQKRLKTEEKDESDTKNILTDNQFEDFIGNTFDEEEHSLLAQLVVNDPIENLGLRLMELGINVQTLPDHQDFLTTQDMFNSQDVPFPVNMKSISTYQLNQNRTLTIGTILLTQLNLPNGIISLEESKEYNLYEGVFEEWSKNFEIENIYFISVDTQIYVFIESTIFPYWRWRSYIDVSYPTEWSNDCRIHNPSQKTSIIWPWS